MISLEKISSLIDESIKNTDLFCVETKIMSGNRIMVFIDGDNAVTIKDCIKLSRYIESNLDREVEDFELNVSSAGVDKPLLLFRQYIKNVGRRINIKTNDSLNFIGKLTSAVDNKVEITLDEPKKKTKTISESKSKLIDFSNIKEANIVVEF